MDEMQTFSSKSDQQISNMKNIKGCSFGRRKLIPDGNLGLHKVIVHNMLTMWVNSFFLLFKFFKGNCLKQI